MSSLNTLSVVANVVQVVNFADTIFCAGKSLYDFIGRYKKFSQSIPHLLLELQSLLSIIAYVRIFLTEFANSQFSHTDGQMLPSINSILTLIEQDFRHLRSLISDTMYDTNDRWYTIISSSLKWARKEQDISGARNRIAQYTANLTAALSVSGRRNDIVMRAKIQSIEGQLHTIVQTQAQMCLHAKLRPPVSQHVLRIPSHSRGSRVIGPKSKKPKSIILGNLTIPEPHSRYYDPNPSLSSSVRNTSHFIVAPLNIAIYEQDDHTILLDSGNSPLASAARTLILMGDYLLSTLQNLPSSSQKTITKNHAFQLEAIFNFLLASCHVASAKSILCRYNPDRTRSDHTIQELQTIAKSSFGFGKTIREVSCCHGGRHHSLITPLGSIETDFITMGGDLTSDDSIVAAMTSNFFPSETR